MHLSVDGPPRSSPACHRAPRRPADRCALGRYGEAAAELELAAAQEDLNEPSLAAIEQRLASVHDRLGDWVPAATHLEATMQLARDDPVTHARIKADRALVAYRLGDERAAEMAEAFRSEAETEQPVDALARAQALNVCGVLSARRGDATAAEALELGLTPSDVHRAVSLHSNFADLLNARGRTEEALVHLKKRPRCSPMRRPSALPI